MNLSGSEKIYKAHTKFQFGELELRNSVFVLMKNR